MSATGASLATPHAVPGRLRTVSGLQVATLLPALLVALPLLAVFSGWLEPANAVWKHLAETVLGELVGNTLLLLAGVGIGVTVLGVSLAWLTAMCEFPGRRLFDWALMLPLAMPAYVLGFVMLGLLDFAGPVQTALRTLAGSQAGWIPEIRNAGGVTLVMVLVLYPYVYMLARAAFLNQGSASLEAARSLGLSSRQAFLRVALPMARPAIAAGATLALMEALADFGTVAIFNYDTFTTAIYKAWFGLFNLQAAAQLASLLLLFVALARFGERRLRGGARYAERNSRGRPRRALLHGWQASAATALAGITLLLAFVIPLAQLVYWAWQVAATDLDARYLELVGHTLALGAGAMCLTVTAALLLALARRHHRNRFTAVTVGTATLGYALPGSVLAVGGMLTLTGIDQALVRLLSMLGIEAPEQLLSGTMLALLLAYVARFMAVAFGPVESSLEKISPSMVEAGRNLGSGSCEILRRIYLPLLRPGLLTAALLVLVDVMKEMPATLLLRPFGWDTLAVRIYEMTSEGEWERAALPAVTLVLVGLLPVILLVRESGRSRARMRRP